MAVRPRPEWVFLVKLPSRTQSHQEIKLSYSAADPQTAQTGAARRHNAMTLLLVLGAAFAFALRINISPILMDRVVTYTDEGGAFYEKLHIGTYAILFMLPLVLFGRPIQLRGDEIAKFKALLFFCAGLMALIVLFFFTGRAGSSVMLVDSYLVAGAAGLIMLALGTEARRFLGNFTIGMLILSAIVGVGEAATHIRLLPYDLEELSFRPLGLSEHPLALGALCATAIAFVALTHWRIWVRVAAIFILFIGCAASGARFSLLIAAGEIVCLLLFVRWPGLTRGNERRAKFGVLLMTLVGGAAMVGVLAAGGLLSRFGETLFDENFMARITVNQAFSLVSMKELLFGMPPGSLLKLVNDKLGLPYIESAQVVLGLTMGVPLALVFIIMVFRMFLKLLKDAPLAAWVGWVTFLLAALSNNTLSAKQPVVTIVVILLLGYTTRPRRDV